MGRLLSRILEHLPRRRRRFWRFVSPRRRSVGMLILAMLVGMLYGYWWLTNDVRIRLQAQQFLSKASGGSVRIAQARFSLFGGIELDDVRVSMPGNQVGEPMFRAQKLLLRHRPWSLLRGKLEPTEVICVGPVVTIEGRRGQQGVGQELASMAGTGGSGAWRDANIPPIRIRDGRLRVIDVEGDMRQLAGEIPLNLSIVPADQQRLVISFEDPRQQSQSAIQGRVIFNLATGRIEEGSGNVPNLSNLVAALPSQYRQWRDLYGLTGGNVSFRSMGGQGVTSDSYEVSLQDVKLRLPADQGGLDLTDVRGLLVFDTTGIDIRSIEGKVLQSVGCQFSMKGKYAGFDDHSPFDIAVELTDLALPAEQEVSGAFARLTRLIRRDFQPRGRAKLWAKVSRDAKGRTGYSGHLDLAGIDAVYRHVPCPMTQMTGRVEFDDAGVRLRELAGRVGKAGVVIDGEIVLGEVDSYDVRVRGTDVELDEMLRTSLPQPVQKAWATLSPTGKLGRLDVRVTGGDDAEMVVTAELGFDGRAGITYADFPYPLERVSGKATVVDDSVEIQACRGYRGQTSVTANGYLKRLGSDEKRQINLTIDCRRVAMDEALAGAMGPRGRAALEALRPSGAASRVTVSLVQQPGKALAWEAQAQLDSATVRPVALPYEVSQVNGTLRLSPDKAVLEGITGRHGEAKFQADGQVLLGQADEVGFDLDIRGQAVAMEKPLREALSESMRDLWDRLGPSGLVDVEARISKALGPADKDKPYDYKLTVTGRDLSIRYRDFPYTFEDVRGSIIATPGKVVIDDVTSTRGEMSAKLSGTLLHEEGSERARLAMKIVNLPIDKQLLGALPRETGLLGGHMSPGGTCDIELEELAFETRAKAATTAPTSQAATAVASADTAPAESAVAQVTTRQADTRPSWANVNWSAKGSIRVAGAQVDLLGNKSLTGGLSGKASNSDEGLAVDLTLGLDSIEASGRKLTKVGGRIRKQPGGQTIRLDDLVAKAHGGGIAGFAEVRLGEPIRYGVTISVDGMSLAELSGAEANSDVQGLLDGRLQLTGSVDKPADRQASGVVRISKAKMYRVPVMLGVLQVLTLSLPSDSAFSDAEMSYYLKGQTLTMEEIWLSGQSVSALGSGTVNMRNMDLKLNFLTGPAGKAPRMRNLAGELLARLSKELMEIQVRGTVKEPRVRTVALGSLERAIQQLTNPDAKD